MDLGALGAVSESIEEWFALFGEDIIHCHFTDGKPGRLSDRTYAVGTGRAEYA